MSALSAKDELIPLLDDFITRPTEGTGNMDKPVTESKPNNPNPFLPYDTIAKLAHEREIFQKQFHEFMEAQKLQPPASSMLADTQDLSRVVHHMTQRIMAEYMPQIEQRVRAEVIRQLNRTVYKD